MTQDEELDALVTRAEDLSAKAKRMNEADGVEVVSPGIVPDLLTAIATLRAQLAEALEWKRYWSGEMDVVLAGRADETDRADRAEAALAAQIEADAGIADEYVAMRERQLADERAKASHHIDVPQIMRWQAGKVQSKVIATAIRNQTHDRTALDRHDAKTRNKALDAASEYIQQVYGSEWTFLSNPVDRERILALIEKEEKSHDTNTSKTQTSDNQ